MTVEQARAYGLPNSISDERAALLIESVELAAKRYLQGRTWTPAEDTVEYQSGTGGPYLYLNGFPLTEIAKVEVKLGGTWYELDYSQDEMQPLDYELGRLWLPPGWPFPYRIGGLAGRVTESVYRNVRVTYSSGWDDLPGDVALAVTEEVARLGRKVPGAVGYIVEEQTPGGHRVKFSNPGRLNTAYQLSGELRGVFKRWRRP